MKLKQGLKVEEQTLTTTGFQKKLQISAVSAINVFSCIVDLLLYFYILKVKVLLDIYHDGRTTYVPCIVFFNQQSLQYITTT